MDAEWNISPAEFLREIGLEFRQGPRWLSVKVCPFCEGGDHRDKQTFAVHAIDGNFSCLRSTCSAGGSFWKLIEAFGRDPREYRGEAIRPRHKEKKKGFIYGR